MLDVSLSLRPHCDNLVRKLEKRGLCWSRSRNVSCVYPTTGARNEKETGSPCSPCGEPFFLFSFSFSFSFFLLRMRMSWVGKWFEWSRLTIMILVRDMQVCVHQSPRENTTLDEHMRRAVRTRILVNVFPGRKSPRTDRQDQNALS
jgi:hypothetical protein